MESNSVLSVVNAFEHALEEILARFFMEKNGGDISTSHPKHVLSQPSSSLPFKPQKITVAVAYSGGLDSLALLLLMQDYVRRHSTNGMQYAAKYAIKLLAFHIHHGLSSHADEWLMHSQHVCEQLGITFDQQKITLGQKNKSGIEEAARVGRYAALGALCQRHDVSLLLTAHHQDDQAETVLLQLLRGSGVAGLSGMDALNRAPNLLQHVELFMARPLLALSRAQLEGFIAHQEISYVQDESNNDPRFARNALRHQVMPSVASYFPGFQERLVRTAQHAQSAQRLLDELAQQDLQICQSDACLDIKQLLQLSAVNSIDRIDNLLRYWLGLHGWRMPSTAWLAEMRSQLLEAKEDAQICITHPDGQIRRYRNRIFLTARHDLELTESVPSLAFRWHGEAQIAFAEYGGVLHFDEAEMGVDVTWLRNQNLSIAYRQGGERLKLAWNRPGKSLKHHYQALGIPPWMRSRLPIVYSEGRLLFAAGVGMNSHYCHHDSSHDGLSKNDVDVEKRVCLRWQEDKIF